MNLSQILKLCKAFDRSTTIKLMIMFEKRASINRLKFQSRKPNKNFKMILTFILNPLLGIV